jgi:hypothetical protein
VRPCRNMSADAIRSKKPTVIGVIHAVAHLVAGREGVTPDERKYQKADVLP